jgi:hypothetical protein
MLRAARLLSVTLAACLVLLLALGGTGGAAVAQAPPSNSVGTAQLKNNAVTSPKIKNNAVVAAKIASNAVVAAKLAGNAVVAGKIASNAVTAPKIAANAVTGDKVQDGSLAAADLAAGALPPSDAFGRFLNGPIAVPTSATTIGSLTVPAAGNYVIFGKAYFTSPVVPGTVTCRLEAGTNFDESQTRVATDAPSTLSLIVLNNFAAAGSVNLTCSATLSQQANFIKIVALRVANLTNTG